MNKDSQTLNSDPVNQEVGGLVSTDRPELFPDQTNLISDIDDVGTTEPASSAADDKEPVGGEDDSEGTDQGAAEYGSDFITSTKPLLQQGLCPSKPGLGKNLAER